jgi:hypothetical protein
MSTFKFIVKNLRDYASDNMNIRYAIYGAYPTVVYQYTVNPRSSLNPYQQKALAVAELKIKLIQEIANAEFEISDDL